MTADTIDRLPPQNPEAEEGVLGSLLMDPEAVGRVASDLKVGDFYREKNAVVYAAALALFQAGRPVDFLTISDELRRAGRYDEIGGLGYLSQLVGAVPTAVHVEHYAAMVTRTAMKRRLISAAGKIAGMAYEESLDTGELMARVQKVLAGVAVNRAANHITTPEELGELLLTMTLRIAETGEVGLLTGFHGLDRLTNGFRANDLIVVLGDTTVGKTAWALSESRNVAAAGGTVLYCSLEMSLEQLAARMAAAIIKGRSHGLSLPPDWDWKALEREVAHHENVERNSRAIGRAKDTITGLPLNVYYQPGMTLLDIRTKSLEMASRGPLAQVVVDYAQLITPSGRAENRVQEMGEISRGLKQLAGELGVPLIALCQINREAVKGRADKRPSLHDARESGSWEQDADILLGVYRDDAYYDAGKKNDRGETVVAGAAELLVLKNRNGERSAVVPMTWRASTAEYLSGTGTEIPW